MRISELSGCNDGVYDIEDIFVYRMTGLESSGKSQGSFYATGYEPQVLQRLAAAGFTVPEELFIPRELESDDEYAAD